MIVDDSMVARAVLRRMIEADRRFEIAAVAGTAEDAIEALGAVPRRHRPARSGNAGRGRAQVDPRRSSRRPRGAKVMIVSSLAEEGAEETVAALALGAADTLPKPGTGRFNGRFSEVLLEQAEGARLCRPGHAPTPRRSSRQRSRRCSGAMPSDRSTLLAIGASTGGIHALGTSVPGAAAADRRADPRHPASAGAVHDRVRAPARRRRRREAVVAEDGMRLSPDRIVIAPGDAHLTVEPARSARSRPPAHGRRTAAACRRSTRCWRRPARSSAPARLASC